MILYKLPTLFLIYLSAQILISSSQIASNPVIQCSASMEPIESCAFNFEPVCAFKASDPAGTAGVTIANSCEACSQQGYDYFTEGACEGINNGAAEIIFVPSEKEQEALNEGEIGEAGENEFTETENNLEGVLWCDTPDLTPGQLACDSILDPVCAYHLGDVEGTTAANACEACGRQKFNYYTLGRCPREDIPIDIEAIPAASISEDL